jgi:hypothetical protein
MFEKLQHTFDAIVFGKKLLLWFLNDFCENSIYFSCNIIEHNMTDCHF